MRATTIEQPKIDIIGSPEYVAERLSYVSLNPETVLNIAVKGVEGAYVWYVFLKNNKIKVEWMHPRTGVGTKCSIDGKIYSDCNKCPNGTHANHGPCEHDTIQKFLRGETDTFDAQLAKLKALYQ